MSPLVNMEPGLSGIQAGYGGVRGLVHDLHDEDGCVPPGGNALESREPRKRGMCKANEMCTGQGNSATCSAPQMTPTWLGTPTR